MHRKLFVLRFLRRWHARFGVTAMLFFLILSVTGLMLNHGSGLGLDGRYLHASWLAGWYGIKAEPPHQRFRSVHHDLVAANGRWLLDGKTIGEKFPQPVGLIELPDTVVIAADASVFVFRDDGELIDQLGAGALPGVPVSAIGVKANQVVLRTESGMYASADTLTWQFVGLENITWSAPIQLSSTEQHSYEEALLQGVSVQQLLLDIHSGRFAGRYGPFIVDALAIMLAVLSLTGAWFFLVARHRRERH